MDLANIDRCSEWHAAHLCCSCDPCARPNILHVISSSLTVHTAHAWLRSRAGGSVQRHVISTHLLRQDVSGVGAHARARVKEYTGNVRITAVLESNRRHGRSSSLATFYTTQLNHGETTLVCIGDEIAPNEEVPPGSNLQMKDGLEMKNCTCVQPPSQ